MDALDIYGSWGRGFVPLAVTSTTFPLQLYEWTADWAKFIRTLSQESKDWLDRIAYAWIYYQIRWLGGIPRSPKVELPEKANLDQKKAWQTLLSLEPPKDTDISLGPDRWRRRTLPLLSRPELGLTEKVRDLIWEASLKQLSKAELGRERERLVTDAFDAAAAATGKVKTTPGSREEEKSVRNAIEDIDELYPNSPWKKLKVDSELL